MKPKYRELRLILLVALTAFAICTISNRFMLSHEKHPQDPDQWLEDQLKLTAAQQTKLAEVESRYDQRKSDLAVKIRAANADLAKAIMEDKRYSERVKKAEAAIHAAQGELKRATLEHFFEMQPHLTPEQRETLNALAVNALYHNP
jgi:Spy/CpxP family protein refolding chaperone